MAQKKITRIIRPATAEERRRHAEIREKVMREFPRSPRAAQRESPPGIVIGDSPRERREV